MNGYCTMAIIPARYGSVRLPGKPLILLAGKTLIQRVCERVKLAKSIDHFCVATDDIRIYNHVKKLGYDVLMTRHDHNSGTYRCAEVLTQFPMVTHVVNIQGDEPFIEPALIDLLANHISQHEHMAIATLVRRIESESMLSDPNQVKVVISKKNEAMYFSRQVIPFVREQPLGSWLEHGHFYSHIGMYAYTADALRTIEKLPPHPYEQLEKLEQLTWLANGLPIHCLECESHAIGIDTEEDVKRVSALLQDEA